MIINNLFPKHANQVAKHNIDTIILNERERGGEEEEEEREKERERVQRDGFQLCLNFKNYSKVIIDVAL